MIDDAEFAWYVGIDWGSTTHEINVGDAGGDQISERVVAHTASAVADFLAWLTRVTGGRLAQVAVAIEMPRGALVDTLLERGVAVFTLNPKQVDRFRDRFSVAGAKDDRLDALVLRSALRTDRRCFRRLTMDEPRRIQLRELGRAEEDLTLDLSRHTNRLREQVYRIAPEWLTLSPDAGDPWFWALLAEMPPFGRRRSLSRSAIDRLLHRHRIRRVTADEVLAVLNQPRFLVAPGTLEAVVRHVTFLLPRLELAHAQRKECARELEALLDQMSTEPGDPPAAETGGDRPSTAAPPPSDIAIMRSTPGIGRFVTTTLVCEASAALHLRDYDGVRTLSGTAPVRRQTGTNKRGTVSMRYACNQRLRQACFHWALTSIKVDAAARAYYGALRARGHSHGRALRSVADRWLRILMAMLKTRTLYDPSRFALNAATPAPVTA